MMQYRKWMEESIVIVTTASTISEIKQSEPMNTKNPENPFASINQRNENEADPEGQIESLIEGRS